jgi:hypothetical protein
MRATGERDGLERFVLVEEAPEALNAGVELLLPGDIGELEVEVLDGLGVGRADEVVEEDLEVRLRGVGRAIGLFRRGGRERRPARLGNVHLRLVRQRVGHVDVGLLEERECPVCRVLDRRPRKPRVHVRHAGTTRRNLISDLRPWPGQCETNAHP